MINHCIWASMIDYPKTICSVLFTGACNFNCAYCYNKQLKEQQAIDFDTVILPHLKERIDFINHVVISGGEPTCDENLEYMVNQLYDNGFVIGLHTNGSNPEVLKKVFDRITFLGVDIKTSDKKYNDSTGVNTELDKIKETVKMIVASGKEYEFRTTLFPKHVHLSDCVEIAKQLKALGVDTYHIQQYYPTGSAEIVQRYTQEQLEEICKACNQILPTVLKTK